MASIQEATRNAMAFATEVLGPDRTKGLRLEEIESGREGGQDVWRITLSAVNRDVPTNALAEAIGTPARRDYKTFTVVKESGEVLSMKIRETARA